MNIVNEWLQGIPMLILIFTRIMIMTLPPPIHLPQAWLVSRDYIVPSMGLVSVRETPRPGTQAYEYVLMAYNAAEVPVDVG